MSASGLINMNPHPEVGYVNQLTIWIRAFTQIWFSLDPDPEPV